MANKSNIVAGLGAVALLLVSASPADARGYGRWHPRHHHRADIGAVFGVLLGVGLLAAVASTAQNKGTVRRDDDVRYDPRYDDPWIDQRGDYRGADDPADYPRDYDRPATDSRDYGGGSGYHDGRAGGGYDEASHVDEDAAVDACAIAARDEASRAGEFVEIRDITGTQRYGSGWDVTGTLDRRANWRAADSRVRSFRCIWDAGRVSGVTFG